LYAYSPKRPSKDIAIIDCFDWVTKAILRSKWLLPLLPAIATSVTDPVLAVNTQLLLELLYNQLRRQADVASQISTYNNPVDRHEPELHNLTDHHLISA
jgi:hypothetical protein